MKREHPNRLRDRIGGPPYSALFGLLICLAAALFGFTASAGAATRGPLQQPGGAQTALSAPRFPDTLISSRRMFMRTGPIPHQIVFPVLGGEHVTVSSTYYSDQQMQGIVNVLGGLVHGEEMNSLSVYVASPDEIPQICGPGALACYAPSISEMVISGVDGSSYGVPRDFTIAHEYGHHIANNRDNAPWTALDTGAKRWATYEHVCQRMRDGQLFPGDEGAHYWDNPGEGWAESNAHMNFPGVSVPWGYNELLAPTQASLARLRTDITSPWTGPTTVTWNGAMWAARRNPAVHTFSTPLDGQVDVRLDGPASSNYDLFLLGPKQAAEQRARRRHERRGHHHRRRRLQRRVIGRSTTGGSTEQLDFSVCGQSSIQVEVRRVSGSGPFSVTVTRP